MGAVVTIDLAKMPEAIRKNERAVREAIAYGAKAGTERGRAIMVRKTPTDLGQLRASWRVFRARTTPPASSGEVGLSELRNDAPHAGIVELGARPHTVNPAGWAAIYEWVRRHPEMYTMAPMALKIRRNPKVAGPLGPFRGPDPQISAITNAIVGKIKRDGQKPTYFIRNALPELARAVSDEIGRALARLADDGGH